MIKTIIFSKNRACQLDVLLRSIAVHYPECDYSVLYTHTDDKFKQGYDRIKDSRFVYENDFKQDLLSLLECEYIMFLTDDNLY